MFLYPGVYGTFGSSDIDLHTVARDSVHSARCFGVTLVLCRIQMFLNFLGRFVFSSYVVFSQNPADAFSYTMDIWKGSTLDISLLVIGLFRTRMQASRYFFRNSRFPEKLYGGVPFLLVGVLVGKWSELYLPEF